MPKFIYLSNEGKVIDGKNYVRVSVLENTTRQVFDIYKLSNSNILEFLRNLKTYEDITQKIGFVIKRDKKISLDINI